MSDQASPPGDGNGRVTMAILNANLLHLTTEVREMRTELCAQIHDHEGRLRATESWSETGKERWRRHDEDHKALSAKNWAADIIGSVAAAIAGIVAGRA